MLYFHCQKINYTCTINFTIKREKKKKVLNITNDTIKINRHKK